MRFHIVFQFITCFILDHDNLYHGHVFGETNTHVQAHMDDGMLTAIISLSDETFHIEVRIDQTNIIEYVQLENFYV